MSSANKFFSATGSSIQTDYSSQGFGFYLDNDGTYYLTDGTPLQAVDLGTGEYQEEDGTWYDNNGNPEDGSNPDTNPSYANGNQGGNPVTNGNVANGGNPSTTNSSSGGFLNTLGNILGLVTKATGTNGANNNTGSGAVTPRNITPPSSTGNTMAIVASVIGIGVVITLIVVLSKGGSQPGAAAPTPAPAPVATT